MMSSVTGAEASIGWSCGWVGGWVVGLGRGERGGSNELL